MKNLNINFRTKSQKVLYDEELRGQISDGNWENEDTDTNLWFCTTKVNPKKVGANWQPRPKLDFDDYDLLDVVGDRMIKAVLKSGARKKYTMDDLHFDLIEMTYTVFELDSESK